jgi:pyruvate,water dikinase
MNILNFPSDEIRQKYRCLQNLLSANTEALEMMADIEADLLHLAPNECQCREGITALIDRVLLLAQDLNLLSDGRYRELYGVHGRIEAEIRQYLHTSREQESQRISFPIREVTARMAAEVGGKAANLGEISKLLFSAVPPGFVLTAAAYRMFIQANNLNDRIRGLLKDLDLISDPHLFKSRTEEIGCLIRNGPVPSEIREAIAQGVLRSISSTSLWAARSSALGEDGNLSYAGQFDTLLNVPAEKLPEAYRSVLASRYSERAMQYRVAAGSAEVDTPMAVLFMPMIHARQAGVLYTQDPEDRASERMLINAAGGLADEIVQGKAMADVFLASRKEPGLIFEKHAAAGLISDKSTRLTLNFAHAKTLVETGLKLEKHFGHPQDIEWAIDQGGELVILQARELRLPEGEGPMQAPPQGKVPVPLMSGGTTIFPGRAVGESYVLHAGRSLSSVPAAALIVVDQATPDLAIILPKIAGLIVTFGNPAGHAATLIREFAVPCVFGMANATSAIRDGQLLSLDATRRAIYEGALWPNVQDRVRFRICHPLRPKSTGFLNERILALNLVDPQAISFSPKSCRTIHDIVRFVHEKAVLSMFEIGDGLARKSAKSTATLKTDVPLNLRVLNLGGGMAKTAEERTVVRPEDIASLPFQALWRGVTSPGIRWTGRNQVSVAGFASVVASSLSQGGGPARRELGADNYLMVATNYLCLNARLAYHFAMVDAMIGEAAENNYVNFRFRGGGAGVERRSLRAQFLAQVLLKHNFGVNSQGDLVTAWLRRYPLDASERGLELIGKLMGCARQLDMVLNSTDDVSKYATKFLQHDYDSFA